MIDLFSTPVKTSNYGGLDLKSIEEYCLSKEGVSLKHSNEGGYHSKFFDLKDDTVLHNLCMNILKDGQAFCDELELKRVVEIDAMWTIINDYGHHNRPHIHQNCLLSGVFYPSTFYPDDCGDLTLKHPLEDIMGYDWDHTQTKYNKYNSLEWSFKPQPGHALIFPSWTTHYVKTNLNKDFKRIAISFNMK